MRAASLTQMQSHMLLLLAGGTSLAASAWAGEAPQFVREGVVVASDNLPEVFVDGQAVAAQQVELENGRTWLQFQWEPLATYSFRRAGATVHRRAPQQPRPWPLRVVNLEDVSEAATADVAPDAVVKFAPDSRRLAIGTFGGWLRVVDCYTGKMLHRQRLAEGMVKSLAWSPDGKQLYVGEQSPDALLFALAAEADNHGKAWRRLWQVRLADTLESSRPPANDRYGRYSLPAVFDVQVADDGRIIAGGLHSWMKAGVLANRSQLVCVQPDGQVAWRYPAKAGPVSVTGFGLDRQGTRLAFFAHQTQAAVKDAAVQPETLYLVDAARGTLLDARKIEPIEHFQYSQSWDSVAVSPDARRAALGLNDGRGLLFDITADKLAPLAQLDLGTPILVGGIPIVAAASYTRAYGDQIFFQTQNTHIPFGTAQSAQRAPAVHRGSNALTVANAAGEKQWLYHGEFGLKGSWSNAGMKDAPGHWLLTTCGERSVAADHAQYGCLLFNLDKQAGGSDRLVYYYPTVGPVFARADLSADGRLIAIVEVPTLAPNRRDLVGAHRLHVVH